MNSDVVNDPSKFAASQSGIGQDTTNAVQLAGFYNQSLRSQNGSSLSDLYNQTGRRGDREFGAVPGGRHRLSNVSSDAAGSTAMAVSGVSIDEETINMLSYQRQYQASAQLISTINTL